MSGQNSAPGQVVGYVRVSSVDQNPAQQVEALGAVDRTFTDKVSGRSTDRPELAALRAYVRQGDTVRVKSPDRLARNAADLLSLATEFQAAGVRLEFVDTPALNLGTKEGRFMLSILGAVAELEREMIRERQAEGIAEAKKRGVYKGRTKALTPEQVAEARERVAAGVPKAVVARELQVSRQTLYDALAGRGVYADLV
ncbi:recombinase family protein [Micrococcus luteus]|nr:recombinase family protein [Micrococcus luteus]MCV7467122.1 recombinase family protein [Micrococcus luteus]